MLLSIIIPLYNCEKYISDTLSSILSQGLSEDEYEIIVINDGSTDTGAEIVNNFCIKYKQIKLINQENQGVSTARNKGIDEAKGEYIQFLDGDDQMAPNSYLCLKKIAQKNPDAIAFESYRVEPHRKSLPSNFTDKINIKFSGTFEDFVRKYDFAASAVFFWFRKDLIKDNNFYFENYKLGEDCLFCIKVLHHYYKHIVYTDSQLYKYIIHNGSTLRNNNKIHLKVIIEDIFCILEQIENIAKDSKYEWEIYSKKYYAFVFSIVTHLLRGHFSIKYNNKIISKLKDKKLVPLKGNGITTKIINIFIKNGINMWIASFFHRYIFLKFIKPFIRTK